MGKREQQSRDTRQQHTLRPKFRYSNNNINNKYTMKEMHIKKLICSTKSLYIVLRIGVGYLKLYYHSLLYLERLEDSRLALNGDGRISYEPSFNND